jgi:hypothetical protein
VSGLCLDVFADGQLIGQVLTDCYREDFEHAGLGSKRLPFVL